MNIVTTSQTYEPVYTNSMPILVSSTFQSQLDYKYLIKLYDVDDNSLLTTISTYPRPDGRGLYSPHYILQSLCDTTFRPSITTIEEDIDARVRYLFKIGEQYNPNLSFSDCLFQTGGFLGLTFSFNINLSFIVGDIITIQKNDISVNPQYDGTASITSIPNNRLIVTDVPYGVATTNESGTIINLTRSSATSSIFVGWNAARQYGDFSNFETQYVLGTQSIKKLLTSYETAYDSDLTQKKSIYTNDLETLDFILGTSSFPTYTNVLTKYEYYDSSNSLLGSDLISLNGASSSFIRYQIPTGTSNINTIGGSGSVFLNNGLLDSYKITVGLNNNIVTTFIQISDPFNYKIIPSCRPYEIIRISFLNKLGGYDYYNFNLVSRFTSDIKRKQINRALPQNYSIGDRGRDVIYSSAVENWTINTDLLTDSDALFIRELVESSSTFLLEPDGNTIPIVITSNNWVYKSGLLDGVVQYTITFEKSNDIYINR